jgi:SAM-dependent methyltransferase
MLPGAPGADGALAHHVGAARAAARWPTRTRLTACPRRAPAAGDAGAARRVSAGTEERAAARRAPFTALADVYDAIMQDVPYDAWCAFVLREVRLRGWDGRRLLDVGCGTGNATAPMIARGYDVVALDASADMAARARAKCPEAFVIVGDVREFALEERVDLVYAVFDALNNLTEDGDLQLALEAMHAQLVPGGWLMFDVNTTQGLRALWEDGVAEGWADGVYYRWSHAWDEGKRLATVEAFCRTDGASFVERHVERPYDPLELEGLMRAAGFEAVEVITYPTGRRADEDEPRVWVVGRRPGGEATAAITPGRPPRARRERSR